MLESDEKRVFRDFRVLGGSYVPAPGFQDLTGQKSGHFHQKRQRFSQKVSFFDPLEGGVKKGGPKKVWHTFIRLKKSSSRVKH